MRDDNAGHSSAVTAERRPRQRHLLRILMLMLLAALLGGGYMWLAEPNWLEVTEETLVMEELPASFDGMRVLHFSDVHLGFNKDARNAERLADAVMKLQPDLICFTGDIVESAGDEFRTSVSTFARMSAPLGKYAVLGNHDYENTELLEQLWEEAGFKLLRNESALLERGGDHIAVSGLEDLLLGEPDPRKALESVPEGAFSLLLMHEPDYADEVDGMPFSLQLSGHSHGGQIRLPLVGPLSMPEGAEKYISGLYYTDGEGMPVYVNRGFGETFLPLRLLCRPELTVLTLHSVQ